MADDATLYAVVRFNRDEERRIDRVILTFPTVRSADLFAQFNQYVDYEVAPISFLDGLLRPLPNPDGPGRSVGMEATR